MENASQALLIAAGILIGVLIISLGVYLLADFGTTSAEINGQVEQQRLQQFNSQFTSYLDKDLTIYDIVTILGYAQENNKYYENSEDEKISVYIEKIDITNKNTSDKVDLLKEYTEESNGELKKFTFNSIDYHKNGRIKTIIFTPKS